jgi:hypothetical protein
MQLISIHYRKVARSSRVVPTLGAEATEIVHQYQPRSTAELDVLLDDGMMVIDAWKTESIQEQGLSLLSSLKHPFPEIR